MAKAQRGPNDARAAMTELIAELDRTRKEYAKVTLQLTQHDTAIQHLKDSELKKDQIIAHLEAEAERRTEQHRQEMEVLTEEYRTKDAAWSHRVKHLELEVQRLLQENEATGLFEKENRTLRDTVMENQATIERLQLINDDLRTRAKEDTSEQAAVLEAEFKRRLADAEKRFRAEAYRALSEEAKVALRGNDHLQGVLQRQNDSIEAVLLRCKQLEQAHSRISHEQEMSQQSLSHHMTEIQRLKKQLGDARSKNSLLEENLKQRKVERASLELLFVEYETTRKQLNKAQEKARRAAREAERWKNRAVQLTHELSDEQREAAEQKLVHIQQQSDRIEGQISKKQFRTERRQKERQAIEDGAAALRLTEGDADQEENWSDLSDEDDFAEGAAKKATGVNPMDILAMWNVNFDGLQTSPEQSAGQGQVRPGSSPHLSPQNEEVSDNADEVKYIREEPEPESIAVVERSPHAPTAKDASRQKPLRVSEARERMDRHLSVLARPKQPSASAPMRQLGKLSGSSVRHKGVTLTNELSLVSHGQFKIAKLGRGSDNDRFLSPM